MNTTRRGLGVTGLALALTGCGRSEAPGDARRDVLAAGQPAALLIWAVARERLLGWPRKPPARALAALPGAEALPELGALAGGGPPAGLEAIAALRPRLIVDYGDADARHRALGDRLGRRLASEWRLIDGALSHIPAAFREAGALLETGDGGRRLAELADRVLNRWRQAPAGPGFYYARGTDGLETAFRGALATEVLEGAGWTNVAVGGRHVGRVSHEQALAWDPEVIVTLDADWARGVRRDRVWRTRRDGTRRRLLVLPDTPFGWVDRPPSVNRLLGCAWLAGAQPMALAELSHALYGRAMQAVPQPTWMH